MKRLIAAVFVSLTILTSAMAAELTVQVPLTLDDAQQAAIVRMYLDACTQSVQGGGGPFGGCTAGGSPPVCTCNPTLEQYAEVLGIFLEGQLTNRYQAMIDAQGKKVGQSFPNLTAEQQTNICAECGGCCN